MRSFVLIALLPITALAQTCYSPAGLPVQKEEVVPCALDGVTSICCYTNRTREAGMSHEGGATADECLPNGICQNRFTYQGKAEATYWIEYCTEKDYASGKCMDICASQRGEAGTSMITPCGGQSNSTKWCCGASDDCCSNPNADSIEIPLVFEGMINGTVASVATAEPTPTPTILTSIASTFPKITSQSAPSSLPSPSQSPSQSPSSSPSVQATTGLSTGSKAGIGIGVTLGALALVGIGFFARKAMGWKKEAQRAKEANLINPVTSEYFYPDKYHQSGFAPSELPSPPPAELAVPPAELGNYHESKPEAKNPNVTAGWK
jgi:hypothetical protein